jgi:hypothetical protein
LMPERSSHSLKFSSALFFSKSSCDSFDEN